MEIALAFLCGVVIGGTGVLILCRSIAKKIAIQQQQETDDDWWKKGEAPPF